MIPVCLKLSGFLSYRDPIEVDFTRFDLACISGANGAGKSSLLDAITWALFGQARKRDESVINSALTGKAAVAEVTFIFEYESETYRVQRRLPQGKTMTLEFGLRRTTSGKAEEWKPLTERTLRDTQARIVEILRLDYDTFVNVSFFLQGHADQFAQQPPANRKDILGKILGLEAWEVYRQRAADRRKAVENEQKGVDGRLQEIDTELGEEAGRKARLSELEVRLEGLVASRKAQEAALASIRKLGDSLESQRELVRTLDENLSRTETNLAGLGVRLAEQQSKRQAYAVLLERAGEVEAAYQAWQEARAGLEKWEQVAAQFREQEASRQPLLREIEAERARLEEEQRTLERNKEEVENHQATIAGLKVEIEAARRSLKEAEARLSRKAELETGLRLDREKQVELRGENERLKTEMDELKLRIDRLGAAEGAVCPLCGQELSPEHRRSTLAQLKADGKSMGDRWRENKAALDDLASRVKRAEALLSGLVTAQDEQLAASTTISQLGERLETLQRGVTEWKAAGAKRLVKLAHSLETEKYALAVRRQLARVDRQLAALGYDAAAHDAARKAEVEARPVESEYRELDAARAALLPLDDEIANLGSQIEQQSAEVQSQQSRYYTASAALAAAESQLPDVEAAERQLFDLQEQENALNQEVGAARQKVTVLDDLRARRAQLESEREALGLQTGRYKALERAFGKEGVPALLIEQALPEIELKANEILGRLSDDSMRLRFETQAKYKDEKRKDLRETLEIRVSDGAGERDYEMFSGGEAFRVNFAIRLALSEVLAGRKGARLQMLIVDEGFGSQDALGRQRLIQAINAVRNDFAKILVITHLEELKDAFPTRIEVEKSEQGSTVRVI